MSFIKKKLQERKQRIEREAHDNKMREVVDRNAKNEHYWPEYRKQAKIRAQKQAAMDANPSMNTSGGGGSSRSQRLARAGNAAQSGLNFLSGGGGFGIGGGSDIANNVNNILDMGFNSGSKSTQPKMKPKRTVIQSGGRKIVISEAQEEGMENRKKKGQSSQDYFENLEKIFDSEMPF